MADTNQKQIIEVIHQTLDLKKNLPAQATPPAIGTRVHQIVREVTGNKDPYQHVKKVSATQALSLLPILINHLNAS